jgi:hypothetical protein
MRAFICNTCGTQHEPSEKPPANCQICEDERQYVTVSGQTWTSLPQLQAKFVNAWREVEPNLMSIESLPRFGIGQRAMLVRTPNGNILWDCIALLDRGTVELVKALGGIKAIAISHPHYYTTFVEWSQAFGAPVYLHAADRKWIMRNDPAIKLWEGDTHELFSSATLIRVGGHFPGGTVMHWGDGAEGKGVLLPGDNVQVVSDNKSVSFMWSYPNLIPLSGPSIEGVVSALKPFQFDRVHGAFTDRTIWTDGKGAVERSADRYLRMIRGDGSYERR